MDAGFDPNGGRKPLAEYLSQWMDGEKSAWRPRTIDQYGLTVRKYINPNIGAIRLMDLRLDLIEHFYSALYEQGVGATTIDTIHRILHRALDKAERYRYVVKNPASKATLPRERNTEMQVLDESQVSSFLITTQGSRHELLFRMAVLYGLRKGELLGLMWSDVQWDSGNLRIARQAQSVKGKGLQFLEPKTRSGIRTIRLGEATLRDLKQHRAAQAAVRETAGERWNDRNLIFANSRGGVLDSLVTTQAFHQLLDQAGLPRIRFHDLRHTSASLMLNNGVPVIVVSKILGHSSPSITLNVYGHLFQERQDEYTQQMEEMLMPLSVSLPASEVVEPAK